MTASKPLPADWTSAPLAALTKRVRRKAEGTPEAIAMITSTGGFVPQSEKYSRFMAGESLKNYTALRRGEFAYNRGNSNTYPQGCIYRQDEWQEAAVPSVYISFRLTDDLLDSDFATQFFAAGGLNRQLKRVITSSARSNGLLNVSVEDFFACTVPLPPLAEQRKIAAVLASVDEAIRATEAVIAQTRRVKDGLLQDLLARGLGHSRFKRTEIGEIPESWETVSVTDIADPNRQTILTGPFGSSLCSDDFVESGVPLLRIGNVQWGYLAVEDLLYVTPDKAEELSKYRVQHGDLLFARQGATTGRNAMATHAVDGWLINYHIIRVATDYSRCIPEYLAYCFNSPFVQRQVDGEKRRGTRQGVNSATIRGFRFALPPMDEQQAICNSLASVDQEIKASVAGAEGLRQVKAGLLQDLLTGAVRVSP
ncbi:MAG: restriction endonuclease subunit S [Bacteroidota bacterium]